MITNTLNSIQYLISSQIYALENLINNKIVLINTQINSINALLLDPTTLYNASLIDINNRLQSQLSSEMQTIPKISNIISQLYNISNQTLSEGNLLNNESSKSYGDIVNDVNTIIQNLNNSINDLNAQLQQDVYQMDNILMIEYQQANNTLENINELINSSASPNATLINMKKQAEDHINNILYNLTIVKNLETQLLNKKSNLTNQMNNITFAVTYKLAQQTLAAQSFFTSQVALFSIINQEFLDLNSTISLTSLDVNLTLQSNNLSNIESMIINQTNIINALNSTINNFTSMINNLNNALVQMNSLENSLNLNISNTVSIIASLNYMLSQNISTQKELQALISNISLKDFFNKNGFNTIKSSLEASFISTINSLYANLTSIEKIITTAIATMKASIADFIDNSVLPSRTIANTQNGLSSLTPLSNPPQESLLDFSFFNNEVSSIQQVLSSVQQTASSITSLITTNITNCLNQIVQITNITAIQTILSAGIASLKKIEVKYNITLDYGNINNEISNNITSKIINEFTTFSKSFMNIDYLTTFVSAYQSNVLSAILSGQQFAVNLINFLGPVQTTNKLIYKQNYPLVNIPLGGIPTPIGVIIVQLQISGSSALNVQTILSILKISEAIIPSASLSISASAG